jgi:alkylation response protein AidB-like acyl-CoA dehydrogenase
MQLQPSPRQQELIAIGRRLARERFAPRADRHDRESSFPFDDYADLRSEGLLGLCVPERYGGLGADFETYCLVAEQIAQGNASTALTPGHSAFRERQATGVGTLVFGSDAKAATPTRFNWPGNSKC